ncbi:DUF3889 domain-containing protein [Bacillus sp. T33-2]|uniref:DUF3889 domain-containing protein n=1 Tax=Bacillus sp. T33-2 TaxID=2054168 RepID=UPI000C7933EF|nr:DUF3889 domain-containing protein [Bacillus sp. T33-2]PLR97864.1 hypothetical protein CVD19_06925 [Bacillus sp. T33-2]
MKKYMIAFIMLSCLFLQFGSGADAANTERQDYEKYGRIAMAVIKEDYPGQPVRDYQYLGRRQADQNNVTDSFKFQLTQNGQPRTATVHVTHNLQNNRLVSLSVTEQSQ